LNTPHASPKKVDKRLENSTTTQAALRAAGRRLFGLHGYDGSSISAIASAANVTAGALYHHFGDKKGLFAAVAEELDAGLVQLAAGVSAKVLAQGGSAWDAFLASIDAFLAAGVDPGGRRIGLTDAPAVLGADGWNAIRDKHGLGAMTQAVRGLQELGILRAGEPRRLARIILGLLYGAIEALPDDAAAASEAMADTRLLIHAMLASLTRAATAPAAGRRQDGNAL
jgi:AcrR family transcriptional regulator